MKQILFLFILGVVHSQFTFSQECVNEVSSNPHDEPTESHLNALPQNNNQSDVRFLNGWEWWYEVQSNFTIPLNNMGQSSGSFYGSNMMHFNHSSSLGHYSYLSFDVQEVMLPENGWELLANNRGWYPDNITEVPMNYNTGEWTASIEQRPIPYMMFYNKFTGIARVFARYGNNSNPNGSINAAEISLYHVNQNSMSGILRLGEGYDRSLDRKSLIRKISAMVPSPGEENLWFSTDFQLSYDPCVCEYESQLVAEFRFISEGKLQLHGASVSTDVNLLEPQNIFNQDFLNAYDDGEVVGDGYMIYKSMKGLVDDYYERLEDYQKELALVGIHNAKVDANLALLDLGKVIFATGITAVTGMSNYTSLIGLIPVLNTKGDKETFGKNTQKAFWKELDKAFGMGFDLMMKENFTKKDEPQEPSMPTATATEMRFSGSLNYSTPSFYSSVMNTPGSKNANSNGVNLDIPQRYPIYDEALGVFALLEKPKIKFSSVLNDIHIKKYKEIIFNSSGNPNSYPLNEITLDEEIQFALEKELKYSFNPVLPIVDYSIEASIVVNSKPIRDSSGQDYEVNNINVNDNTIYKTLPSSNVNIESMNFNVSDEETLQYDSIYSVSSPYLPLNSLLSLTSGVGFKRVFKHPDNFCADISWHGNCDEHSPTFEDEEYNDGTNPPYHLIEYDQNNFGAINWSEYYTYRQSTYDTQDENAVAMVFNNNSHYINIEEVYLKLIINVTYEGKKSDGSPHEYTYMYTYEIDTLNDVNVDYVNPLYPNLPGSSSDITQYPENLFLDGETFSGSQVAGCQLYGDAYICKAWNDITLSGNFSVANNYKVFVDAGNEVIVLSESITPPEMVWQIVPVLDFSSPMPPVDEAYVSSFCNNTSGLYKARSSKMPIFNNDSTDVFEEDRRDNFAFNIFPNPTSGSSTASITLNESATAELFITDMNGRTLGEALNNPTLRAGQSEHQLPTASLTRGIYLVHLYLNGERHVKKLIVQ